MKVTLHIQLSEYVKNKIQEGLEKYDERADAIFNDLNERLPEDPNNPLYKKAAICDSIWACQLDGRKPFIAFVRPDKVKNFLHECFQLDALYFKSKLKDNTGVEHTVNCHVFDAYTIKDSHYPHRVQINGSILPEIFDYMAYGWEEGCEIKPKTK